MTIVIRPTCWHQNFGPNGLSAPAQGLCLNVFSSITADFNISSAIRWAIQDQWSSGFVVIEDNDDDTICCCYAPNFEEVDGAYWFRVVRASVRLCVRSSKTVHARVLKFHIWIPHGKIVDARFFFLVRVISLSGVMPLWKNQNEIWCMPHFTNRAC